MIKLVIDGACADCPWRKAELFEAMGDTIARCIHGSVCKYLADEKQWGIKQFETFTNAPIDTSTTDKKTP